MELPRRERGDELLRPGELLGLRQRLRNIARRHDLTTVIACAFDQRTRMLPHQPDAERLEARATRGRECPWAGAIKTLARRR